MPLSIHIKPDSTSKANQVKRNGRTLYPWRCGCPTGAWQSGLTHNPSYLSLCPVCGTRREDGKRV